MVTPNKPAALAVYAGKSARQRLAEKGWDAELFSLVIGASGGPKWFVLSQLDRVLFGDFLTRSTKPLHLLGSSIGSWRHACAVQTDPIAALERLEAGYLNQHYASKPTAAQIRDVSHRILVDALGDDGWRYLVTHERVSTHIVTARGRGLAGSDSAPGIVMGMTAAALSNAIHRSLLQPWFQRVVFSGRDHTVAGFSYGDFANAHVSLQENNVIQALLASASIPFVMTGERDIPGAKPGKYWDGGIIDYHFDMRQYKGDGLVLYPHFRSSLVPGWFDKSLPWRKASAQSLDKVVLLCPTDDFISSLPYAKIPDRGDFMRLDYESRVAYWSKVVAAGRQLAEEFCLLIEGENPLAGVRSFA